ncbi:hypothetical protein V6N13_080151 [Hibiscus sabdariffa]|uniref:Legume lectin domain-containing protein n=1 Tax=Hibiscus sabdariffa TaxID=183260 RepID=A0ABR2PY50_9ROSI
MATSFISSYLTALTCLFFFFKLLGAEQSSSFSFKSFGKDPKFEANIALYGDAHVAVGNDGSWIQLTDSVSWSAGAVMYKKPIKLVEGKVRNFASFTTYFSFSMYHGNGGGLAFIMVPGSFKVDASGNSSFGVSLGSVKNKSGIVAVEFDTFRDAKHGDLNENHVGIDVGLASVKARNSSSPNLVLNNGEILRCWIDYEATSKRLEIRLSQTSSSRPDDPLLSYSIDLSKLWNDEEVFVGLSSSSGNYSQTCFIHSWSFELRQVPNWMHSQPLDPEAIAKNPKPLPAAPKSNKCFWKVLVVFIFGGACGALTASCVLHLCNVFRDRLPVVPEKRGTDPVDFEYKKVEVVVIDDAVKDGKK